MKTWILILTLGSGYGQPAPTVTSVPGFTTLEACQSAGQQWKHTAGIFSKFQCVPTG